MGAAFISPYAPSFDVASKTGKKRAFALRMESGFETTTVTTAAQVERADSPGGREDDKDGKTTSTTATTTRVARKVRAGRNRGL